LFWHIGFCSVHISNFGYALFVAFILCLLKSSKIMVQCNSELSFYVMILLWYVQSNLMSISSTSLNLFLKILSYISFQISRRKKLQAYFPPRYTFGECVKTLIVFWLMDIHFEVIFKIERKKKLKKIESFYFKLVHQIMKRERQFFLCFTSPNNSVTLCFIITCLNPLPIIWMLPWNHRKKPSTRCLVFEIHKLIYHTLTWLIML